jgi:hypothetical protein
MDTIAATLTSFPSISMPSLTSFPSISTPCEEKALSDFVHLFKTPPKAIREVTASPPSFSNIVLKTVHDAEIDLEVLFNVLPIIKISPEEIKAESRLNPKVNYNQIFISVRKYPKYRGYRGPSNIKSFLDLDFYLLNRSFHIKVSNNKLTIVGGETVEISEYLIKTIYEHLKTLHLKWSSFGSISREKLNEISKRFLDEEPPEDPIDLQFYSFLDVIIDRKNEDIVDRLQSINPILGKPLYKTEPNLTSLINCNSVFDYRLPEEISLAEKANDLFKKGYTVMFHNCIIVKRMKAIWVDPISHNRFSFSIQNIGNIKQNSACTHEESLVMYKKFVRDIGYLPYEEGKAFAVKAKPKSTESVEKSEECIKILDYFLKSSKKSE